MANAPDPLEVLAFIDGYSNMPGELWRARFPDWCKLIDRARSRFDEECRTYRVKWGERASGSSEPGVQNVDAALHIWVYLPLIQAALAANQNSARLQHTQGETT